jgi:hypothetical protein
MESVLPVSSATRARDDLEFLSGWACSRDPTEALRGNGKSGRLESSPPIDLWGTVMDFELDHLYVLVSAGAGAEAERLAGLGLTEGPPNHHPGQGTACRRFVFANAFLELLWVCDATEAQSEATRPLGLWERWSGRSAGACPFGVCLRPSRSDSDALPFPGWAYRPAYLPEPLFMHMGACSATAEGPALVHLPFSHRPDSRPERHPLEHALGVREITRAVVRGPHPPSPAAEEAARRAAGLRFQPGAEHLLEVGFDGERAGRSADLRPLLPLLLRW